VTPGPRFKDSGRGRKGEEEGGKGRMMGIPQPLVSA